MPNRTPGFGLRYPSGSDAPCDFDEQWCDFTDDINTVLATFQTGIDRAVPVVPAALLRTNQSHSVASSLTIPFDEVVLDTAAMTDIDADPYHITIRRPGRYTVAAYIEKNTSGNVNSQLSLFLQDEISPPPGNHDLSAVWSCLDRGPGLTYFLPAYQSVAYLAANDRVSTFFNTGIATPEVILAAWLCVFWHSDTEAPV